MSFLSISEAAKRRDVKKKNRGDSLRPRCSCRDRGKAETGEARGGKGEEGKGRGRLDGPDGLADQIQIDVLAGGS